MSRLAIPVLAAAMVAFVPGATFHPNGGGLNTMRLNFSHPSPDRIAEGVERLARGMAGL